MYIINHCVVVQCENGLEQPESFVSVIQWYESDTLFGYTQMKLWDI